MIKKLINSIFRAVHSIKANINFLKTMQTFYFYNLIS